MQSWINGDKKMYIAESSEMHFTWEFNCRNIILEKYACKSCIVSNLDFKIMEKSGEMTLR